MSGRFAGERAVVLGFGVSGRAAARILSEEGAEVWVSEARLPEEVTGPEEAASILENSSSVQRELLLVKVKADLQTRTHVLETARLFRAKVVDVAPDAVTIEATGNAEKLEALLRVLEPFGVRELVQSGMVAIGRGSRSITDRALRTA